MYNEARKTSWGDGFIIDKTIKTHSTTSKFMKGIKKESIVEMQDKVQHRNCSAIDIH